MSEGETRWGVLVDWNGLALARDTALGQAREKTGMGMDRGVRERWSACIRI